MIETLPIKEASKTFEVTFRWQGMSICLEGTRQRGGKKYLLWTVEDVGTVGVTVHRNMARWITYTAGGEKSDVLVCTISNGSVSPATSKSMGER